MKKRLKLKISKKYISVPLRGNGKILNSFPLWSINETEQLNYSKKPINETNEQKDEMISVQTHKIFNTEVEDLKGNIKRKSKIKGYNSSKDLKKQKFISEIQFICKNVYKSPNKPHIKNIKFLIANKLNEFTGDLTKNILSTEVKIEPRSRNNEEKKVNKLYKKYRRSFEPLNKLIIKENKKDEEIIKKYYDELLLTARASNNINKGSRINYGNYAVNVVKYQHPNIYKLKNNIFRDKLPVIKLNSKSEKELTSLIPDRENEKKKNKELYSIYQTMKDSKKNNFYI